MFSSAFACCYRLLFRHVFARQLSKRHAQLHVRLRRWVVWTWLRCEFKPRPQWRFLLRLCVFVYIWKYCRCDAVSALSSWIPMLPTWSIMLPVFWESCNCLSQPFLTHKFFVRPYTRTLLSTYRMIRKRITAGELQGRDEIRATRKYRILCIPHAHAYKKFTVIDCSHRHHFDSGFCCDFNSAIISTWKNSIN